MAVKGTWTTGSPPNHIWTILGLLLLGVILVVGLVNHADQTGGAAPVTRPTPTATASPSRSAPVARPTVTPVSRSGRGAEAAARPRA